MGINEEAYAAEKEKRRAQYWAERHNKPEANTGGGLLVCGDCMDFAGKQTDPRARAVAIRAAAGGPWKKLGKTADGQTAYQHVGCPWRPK